MEADGPCHLAGNAAGERELENRALALQTIEPTRERSCKIELAFDLAADTERAGPWGYFA